MTKYLNYDEEIRILRNREELEDYLQFRKTHDEWVEEPINECTVIGIDAEVPIMIAVACTENGIDGNAENVECIRENGLFLSFVKDGERIIMPTRAIAFNSICDRAGLNGPTISNFKISRSRQVLPVVDKAAWLTRGMSLEKRKCKILKRDEKISAMLSSEYVILPADELVPIAEREIKKEHPDYEFMDASISHEYLHVRYLCNNPFTDGRIQLLLKDIQYGDFDSVKCGIGFATSDVGLSSAFVYPFLKIKDMVIRFGDSIAVKHDGSNSVDIFKEKMEKVGTIFKEAEDQIEKLGNIDLESIPNTVRNIVNDHRGTFPKIQADEVIAELESEFPNGEGTAIDAYIALNDIITRYCATKKFNPSVQLNMMDRVTKFLYANYSKYDHD